jgi:import inner membrane translocase subunit TIM23
MSMLPRHMMSPLLARSIRGSTQRNQIATQRFCTSALSSRQFRPSTPVAASSSASSSSTPLTPPSTATSPQRPSILKWDRYLKLRKQRRIAGIVTTIPTTVLAAVSSGSYFLTQEIDPTNTIGGIDPVYVYALLTLSCTGELYSKCGQKALSKVYTDLYTSTGLGYLVGPTLGASLWSLFHSKHRGDMEKKDRDFYTHISAMRVDPSRQTMQNRLPDHYVSSGNLSL